MAPSSEKSGLTVEQRDILEYSRERYLTVIKKTCQNLKFAFVQSGTDLSLLEELERIWAKDLNESLDKRATEGVAVEDDDMIDFDPMVPQADGNDDDDDDDDDDENSTRGDEEYKPDSPNSSDSEVRKSQSSEEVKDDVDDDDDDDDDDLVTVASSKYYREGKSEVQSEAAYITENLDVEVDGFGNDLGLEKPVNCDDDLTEDDDPSWTADSKITCIIKKLTRAQGVWKMQLRDGILEMDGLDYFFKKATLNAKW